MDQGPFHPMIVHLPLALAVVVPLIGAGIWLAWWRAWLPRRTWIVAVVLQGLLVAGGAASMSTGETDEHRAEKVVPEAAIEAHEEAAEVFVWSAAATLLLFVGAALIRDERRGRALAAASLAASLAVLGLGIRTGSAGGRLVYGPGAPAAALAPATTAAGGPAAAPDNDADSDSH